MKYIKYLSWFLLVPFDLLATCLCVLLAPFIVPFAKEGKLPKLFWWMETFDNNLSGDNGHIARWKPIRYRFDSWGVSFLGLYLQQVAWLWRNKAYNFSYYVCGRKSDGVKWKGNSAVESDPERKDFGWLWMWNEEAWGLFGFIPTIKIKNTQFYLRVYLGWKLKGEVNAPDKTEKVMMVIHVNPFRNARI